MPGTDGSLARRLASEAFAIAYCHGAERSVFCLPGVDSLRPRQQTSIGNLFLAGDWTTTGWPATMEGAVRSGYLAAEGVHAKFGVREKLLVDDLPRPWLARMLIGK